MVYDDVGRHVAEAGSFERAAVPLGMYVAWLANHQLLGDTLGEHAATLITRVRVRDVTGSELLVSGLGGVLASEHLSAAGQAFTEQYYAWYLEALVQEFGGSPYDVEDDWQHYDRIAPRLTAALLGTRRPGRQKWWKFWR